MRIFQADRFGVVQTKPNGNLLLRGNIPLDQQNQFAYAEIQACLPTVDLDRGSLLDVCLIDNVGERYMWEPEMKSFGVDVNKYPPTYWPPWTQEGWVPGAMLGTSTLTSHGKLHHGSTVWWPIEAPGENEDPKPYLHSPGWDLDGLVTKLIGWLETSEAPRAIYVHCTLGADRTGAVIAAYLIKTQGLTAAQAIEAVTQGTPSKVAPSPAYQRLILEYGIHCRT